jgi:hypothetical protein
LFTGSWRKTYTLLGMCGSGNGTSTRIYVRYHGAWSVAPKAKSIQLVGRAFWDTDGVWFYTSADDQSNTMTNLTFPRNAKTIEYVLAAKPGRH